MVAEIAMPRDFVPQIASASTGQTGIGAKRNDYVSFGIREY